MFALLTQFALDSADEFIDVNDTVSVFVEGLEHLGGVLLANLESVVDEGPAEVVQINGAITHLVNSFKNAGQATQAQVALVEHLVAKLSNQFLCAHIAEFLNWSVEFRSRSQLNHPLVLNTLVAARHISSESSLSFKSQILSLVNFVERVAGDLVLSAEVVLVGLGSIGSQVLTSRNVAQQDRLARTDGLSLALHTIVGVKSVNNPDHVEAILSVHTGLLVVAKVSMARGMVGSRAQHQSLLVQVRVCLNTHFLPVTHKVISPENVYFLNLFNPENVTSARSLLAGRSAELAGITDTSLGSAYINCQVAVCCLGADHALESNTNKSVLRVRHGHLLVAVFHLVKSLVKWQSLLSATSIIVLGLNSMHFVVLVPVTNAGLVGEGRAALQLLSSVLHFKKKLE